jgi:hypothetical protein
MFEQADWTPVERRENILAIGMMALRAPSPEVTRGLLSGVVDPLLTRSVSGLLNNLETYWEKVGCECVRKTGDAGLKRKVAEQETKIRHRKEANKINQIPGLLEMVSAKIQGLPHPVIKGKTLLDWVEWMMTHSGNAGKIKVLEVLRKHAVVDGT